MPYTPGEDEEFDLVHGRGARLVPASAVDAMRSGPWGGGPGPKGDKGDPGVDGQDGIGLNGADGDHGLSAYELALLGGFAGSMNQWLASLRGERGEQGLQGGPGTNGTNGLDGAPGLPGVTTWAGLGGKPATFPPSAHTHGEAVVLSGPVNMNLIGDTAIAVPFASWRALELTAYAASIDLSTVARIGLYTLPGGLGLALVAPVLVGLAMGQNDVFTFAATAKRTTYAGPVYLRCTQAKGAPATCRFALTARDLSA